MEVCRKCKKTFEETDEYINVLSSWTLGFIGRGKYHLDCWDKSKKTGIILRVAMTVFSVVFAVVIVVVVTVVI